MAEGTCRLCGAFGPLTFEHIPPKSSGNRFRAKAINVEEWLRQDSLDYDRGIINQRGMGDEVLCGHCNSFLGRTYVNEYREWAIWGRHVLGQVPREVPLVTVTVGGRRPLRFLKQCVAMLACTNPPPFLDIHPGLRKFVLDPNEKALKPDVEVYLTLYRGPGARRAPISGLLNLAAGSATILTEVAFPPFSVVMTLGAAPDGRPGRITSCSRFDLDEVADVRLTLAIGEGHTPFPGDYRSRSEVEEQGRL